MRQKNGLNFNLIVIDIIINIEERVFEYVETYLLLYLKVEVMNNFKK